MTRSAPDTAKRGEEEARPMTLRERIDEAERIVNELFDEIEAWTDRALLALVPECRAWIDEGGEA
jgi:hypothetical protein